MICGSNTAPLLLSFKMVSFFLLAIRFFMRGTGLGWMEASIDLMTGDFFFFASYYWYCRAFDASFKLFLRSSIICSFTELDVLTRILLASPTFVGGGLWVCISFSMSILDDLRLLSNLFTFFWFLRTFSRVVYRVVWVSKSGNLMSLMMILTSVWTLFEMGSSSGPSAFISGGGYSIASFSFFSFRALFLKTLLFVLLYSELASLS